MKMIKYFCICVNVCLKIHCASNLLRIIFTVAKLIVLSGVIKITEHHKHDTYLKCHIILVFQYK